MKNKYLLLALCCISLVFMGCPYNSAVSIDDKPSEKIDSKLLGKWQKRSSDDVTYVVTKKDENTYSILEKNKPVEGSTTKQEDKTYEAFLSNIGGAKFLNLYDPSEDTKSYYFYKIEISDEIEGFTLFPMTEYVTEKFEASADLKKFVTQYKDLSFFYGTKDEYIKVGK
jgi:hypothetical protein